MRSRAGKWLVLVGLIGAGVGVVLTPMVAQATPLVASPAFPQTVPMSGPGSGAASSLSWSTDRVLADNVATHYVKAEVRDEAGNPVVGGTPVRFNIPEHTRVGLVTGPATVTVSTTGNVAKINVAADKAGGYAVTATVGGEAITNTGPAAYLQFEPTVNLGGDSGDIHLELTGEMTMWSGPLRDLAGSLLPIGWVLLVLAEIVCVVGWCWCHATGGPPHQTKRFGWGILIGLLAAAVLGSLNAAMGHGLNDFFPTGIDI
jgi:hypothetical protein